MNKNLLSAAAALLFASAVMAVPARRGMWQTVRLADGSTVRVELRGDEFAHWYASEDGTCYQRIEGSDVFKKADKADILKAGEAKRAKVREIQTERAKKSVARMGVMGGDHDPYVGEKRCLVFLINFADKKFEAAHDSTYYVRMTNEENFTDDYGNTKSVKDFFKNQSYGNLDITFDVIGPIDMPENSFYYAGYNGVDKVTEMVRTAVQEGNKRGVDFSKYDWDKNGEVEQMFFLYAGHGRASYSGDNTTIWPHMYYLSQGGGKMYVDGVYLDTYACSNELSGLAASGKGDGIGTMCHEFSHCMGLPDMYDTLYGGNYGMNRWDIMDQGSYNGGGSGYTPAGYTSYERMYCGWLAPKELTEETEVSGMKGLTEGGEAYVIYNKKNNNEYYLLENRTPVGFDAGLPGSGMLILHVDFNSSVWQSNMVNTNSYYNDHQRCTVIPADNIQSSNSAAGDAWPGDHDYFNNTSTPAATLYNANDDGKKFMNISLADIAKAEDGTISFKFYPTSEDPNHGNKPDGALFYESFDYCEGTGGNDGKFGAGIKVSDFAPDNKDWNAANKFGADRCALFGTNRSVGNVQTPTLTVDGEATVIFRAAPYTAAQPGTLLLTTDNSDITLSDSSVELKQGEWTDVTVKVTGTGDFRLRIKESGTVYRFFLDEVAMLPGGTSGISETVTAGGEGTADKKVYTLDGRYVGNSTSSLPKGIYIVGGKKVVISKR